MRPSSLASARHVFTKQRPGALDKFARRMVLKQLGRLQTGTIELVEDGSSTRFGDANTQTALAARIEVLDTRILRARRRLNYLGYPLVTDYTPQAIATQQQG